MAHAVTLISLEQLMQFVYHVAWFERFEQPFHWFNWQISCTISDYLVIMVRTWLNCVTHTAHEICYDKI